ncbi:hypothetical protein AB0B57_23515 [Micromonospora sp. NPDC049101]|uniref:hypothetical protein n=1 Tax=unclassified Micromonospora TaxID=2617518 RepID=UPI0033F2B8EB
MLTSRLVASKSTSTTYGTELAAHFQNFWNAYQKMTPEERANLASHARQQE